MSIIYIDRKGHKRQGETGQDRLLAFIYGHAVTRCLIRPFLSPVVSRIGGAFLDTRISGLAVPGFVKKNGIDLSLYEKQTFDSYNDFFTRKIRVEERPVNPDANVLMARSACIRSMKTDIFLLNTPSIHWNSCCKIRSWLSGIWTDISM